jgi:hypothetical protein
MFWRILYPATGALLAGLLLLGNGPVGAGDDDVPPVPGSENTPDVQARGPVHEAYAEPSALEPLPSPVVPKEPPQPIEETPPEQKPEGDHVVWIPGYWSWDEEAKDFLWVSGFWRNVPPGRRWVPGSWQNVEGGFQWVRGYWADDKLASAAPTADPSVTEQYLAPPPESIERGPTVPAPDPTSIYIPGNWVWREARYAWRPGFWCAYRPGWVWTPACYQWTPCGYVYVEGYWDYPLCDRGLLFAPVRFPAAFFARRVPYTPAYVVQPDFLIGALFVRRTAACYYFGDYFNPGYARNGFVPWIDYRLSRSFYDPSFAYYRHTFAGHAGWERSLRSLYAARLSGEVPPPPRTLRQQNSAVLAIAEKRTATTLVHSSINLTKVQNVSVLAPVARVGEMKVTALSALAGATVRPPVDRRIKLERLSKEQLATQTATVTHFRTLAQQRHKAEATLARGEGVPRRPTDHPLAAKITLPKGTPPHPAPKVVVKPPPPLVTRPSHPEHPVSVPKEPSSGGKAGPHPPPKETPKTEPPHTPKTPPPPAPAPKPPAPAPKPPAPAPKPPAPAPAPAPLREPPSGGKAGPHPTPKETPKTEPPHTPKTEPPHTPKTPPPPAPAPKPPAPAPKPPTPAPAPAPHPAPAPKPPPPPAHAPAPAPPHATPPAPHPAPPHPAPAPKPAPPPAHAPAPAPPKPPPAAHHAPPAPPVHATAPAPKASSHPPAPGHKPA